MNDCSVSPCGLCKRRAQLAGLFVYVPKTKRRKQDGYVCSHCIPIHSPRIDMSRDSTDVWETGSDGWLSAPSCMDCGEEIEVTVGADRDCPDCGADGPHAPKDQCFCCAKCGATFDAY